MLVWGPRGARGAQGEGVGARKEGPRRARGCVRCLWEEPPHTP